MNSLWRELAWESFEGITTLSDFAQTLGFSVSSLGDRGHTWPDGAAGEDRGSGNTGRAFWAQGRDLTQEQGLTFLVGDVFPSELSRLAVCLS